MTSQYLAKILKGMARSRRTHVGQVAVTPSQCPAPSRFEAIAEHRPEKDLDVSSHDESSRDASTLISEDASALLSRH